MILSIITINKNNALGLEKTIKSVVCQTSSDFEYIIIDGASTDRSTAIIKNYSDKIKYWISESDTGIYNAMNKGIRKAEGDFCLFLNSGDFLINHKTIENVINEISNLNADIFYSDAIKSNNTVFKYPAILTIYYLISGRINHQNSLIKRNLFINHGFYNENLKIASDWEFFLFELHKYKSIFTHIETNISIFDINGIGSQQTIERSIENKTVLYNVFHELADIFIEYYNFRKSIYFYIFNSKSNFKLLRFLLKIYYKIFNLFLKKY